MADNRMPTISRINKETRDNDFIPITELKDFDKKLKDVIDKFNTIHVNGSDNLANKLKNIEYNLADAIISYDPETGIYEYDTITDDKGNKIPNYGPKALTTMVDQLHEYYNEFIKLMGNDPNRDNWKEPLNTFFVNELNEFENKISSIFKNSINAAVIEAKDNDDLNYMSKAAVKLQENDIMRLNPDVTTYLRTININIIQQYRDIVAFEITEAETKSFVMNLKIQNGQIYYDLDIILDNDNWFINKSKIIGKENFNNTLKLNIYRYTKDNKNNYVFCINTDCDQGTRINFEIQGIFVQKFNFNNSNLLIDNHNEYYKYIQVEDTSVTPIFNETYYTIEVDANDTDNYTKSTYVPHTRLTSFDQSKTYYTRKSIFTLIKTYDIINAVSDGEIKDDVIDVKTDDFVVDDIIQKNGLHKVSINYEIDEAIDNYVKNQNVYIGANDKTQIDDSYRCYKIDRDNTALVTKSVKKVDKKISCAYGEALFDLTEIGFNQIVSTNSYVNENIRNYIKSKVRDIDNTNRGKSERFVLSANTVYKLQLNKLIDTDSDNLQPKYNLVTKQTNLSDINPNLNLDTINEFIFKNITFVTFVSFDIYEVGGELSVIAIPDNNTITDSNIYYHFVINVGKNSTNIDTIKVLVFNKMYKRDDEFVGKYLLDETFVSVAANDSIMVGITDKNEIYYSFYGDLWYPNKSFNETYANDHFYENFIQGKVYNIEWTGKIFIYYPDLSNNQLDADHFEVPIFWSYDGLNWNKFIIDKYFVDATKSIYYATLKIYNEDRIAFFYLRTDDTNYDETSHMNEYIPRHVMICDNYFFTHYNSDNYGNFNDNNLYSHRTRFQWASPINLQYVDNKWVSFYNGTKNNINISGVEGSYLAVFKDEGAFGRYSDKVYQKNFKTDGILYGETDDETIHENGWNVSPTINYNRLFASNDGVMFLYDDSVTPSVNAKMPLHILEIEDQDDTTKIFLRATVPNDPIAGDPNGKTAVKFVDVSTRYKYFGIDNVYRRIFGLDNNNNIVAESNDDGISWHKPYIDGSGNIGSYKYILRSKCKYVSTINNKFFVQNNTNSKLCTLPYNDENNTPSAGYTYDNGATPKKIIEINHQSVDHGWFIIISNTGKLSYYDNTSSIRQCSIMIDDPVTSLIELNDRILGETSNHNISPNYGYDDMYDPYTDYDIGIDRDIDINLYKTVNGYEFYLDVKRDSNNNLLGYTDLMYRQGKLDHGIYCRFDFATTYFKPDNYFVSYNCKERGNTYNPIIFLISDETPGIIFGELNKASEYDSNNEPIDTVSTYYMELPIYVENAVENSDGFFIYGRDDYDIYHVYVSKATNNDIHFEEILEVDGIDFFKAINDEIIISAYGSDPDEYYVYDKDTVSFITREYLENSERYDFSQLFEHKGKYYFINGTGTNYNQLIAPGLYQLDFSQNVVDHKKDISIIKQENGNFNTSNQNMINYTTIIGYKKINFIPNIIDDNNVDSDLICISGIDSGDNPISWIYIVDWSNGDLIDLNSNNINFNSDYIATLKEILQKKSNKYINELIVQKSAYSLNAVLNDSVDFDKYCQKDEIYFDKESKTLEFNNYGISNDDKFIIESKKIAVSQTMNSNKLNIIMVLSQDSAIGYYNRNKKEINVLKCGFYLDNIYVNFDTNYNNMKSVIIGDNGHIEYAFIVVDGILPYLINGQVTYPIPNPNSPSIEEHHLFKIAIKPINDGYLSIEDSIISGADNISLEKVGTFATYQDIYDYIEGLNFSLSKSIYLYENENIDSYDSEFLGVYSDALYDNSYSFVEWNTVKKCLEFKTKLLFDTSLTNSLDRDHNIITDRLVHVDPQNFNTDYDKVIYVESNHSIPFNTDRNNSTDSGVDLAPINFTNKKIINPILDLQDRKNYDLLRSPDLTYSYKYTGQYQTPYICFNYLQHLQTQYGVFRFANKNYFDCLRKSTHVGDVLTSNNPSGTISNWSTVKLGYLNLIIDYNVRTSRNYSNNIYFSPHGSKDIIRIIPDHDATIVEIYETYSAGIFIQVEDHIVFDDKPTTVYKLYHLINLPVDTNNPTIIIGDTRYFDEMSTNYAEITDLKECSDGVIYALGVEPSGLSVLDEEVANIGNANVGYYPRGKSFIFKYNGLDFAALRTFYLDKDNYVSWPYLTKIFEQRSNSNDVSGTYGTIVRFHCIKCFDNTNSGRKYTSEIIDLDNNDDTDSFFGNLLNNTDNNKYYVISPESIEASKNHIMLPKPIEDVYSNVIPFLFTYFYGPNGTTRVNQMKWINIENHDSLKDVLMLTTNPIFSDQYYTKQRNWILTYPMFSKTTSDNLYLSKLLNNINNNSPDFPLNTNLHAIGFIIYKNNSKVLIDGVNIVTNAGDNIEPVKIIFNIDKRFRNVSGLNRSDIENGQIVINNDSDMIKANFDIIY